MSQTILTKQSAPTTPANNNISLYADSNTGKLASKDDSGVVSYYDSVGDNAIINGECTVAQAFDVSLSTTAQFGKVDRFAAWGTGTAVSAGTITQDASASIGKGYALHLSGVTITGTGIVYVRHRIEKRDAVKFKNEIASFSMKVLHDVGSDKNYTITIRKANSADNFSAVTDIQASSALPVVSGIETTIKLENVSMGDCSNGIEIEVKCECGAITTKNFRYAEFKLELGSSVSGFRYKDYSNIYQNCLRYCYVFDQSAAANLIGTITAKVTAVVVDMQFLHPVEMFAAPTLSQAGSTSWVATAPSGNQIANFNGATGAYMTISGSLTISYTNQNKQTGILRCQAGVSFNGSLGDVGQYYVGNAVKLVLRAEP